MDVHEENTTIREAMRFSAYLRQPFHVTKEEKDAYVEDMIELLELQDLSEAVVWSLGVEARKRLTIGVELASKPELLLFLDEPTSGLDAQSAWNLVRFLRKLADSGQAILCTIHQPSSLLFESFDRLLLLGKGGNTIYFGDIGEDSHAIANTSHDMAHHAHRTSIPPSTCSRLSGRVLPLGSETAIGRISGLTLPNSLTLRQRLSRSSARRWPVIDPLTRSFQRMPRRSGTS
jgi:ABC-type multidrug transport system ATPase subunit